MVSQTAIRRMNTISGHFGAGLLTEDITAPTTNLLPLNCSSNFGAPIRRLDNRMHYGRQASASQGYFMRQAVSPVEESGISGQFDVSCKSYINEKECTANPTPPFFSRSGSGEPQFAKPEEELNLLTKMSEFPKFARPIEETREKKLSSQSPIVSSQINGIKLSPRINFAESKCSYLITVELLGVEIRDIRVEIDDKNGLTEQVRQTDSQVK